MKFEINLQDLFDPGEGATQSAIRNAVVDNLSNQIGRRIDREIEETLNEKLGQLIHEKVDAALDKVIPELLDYEFTETTSWGETKGTYTVRNRILKEFEKAVVYQPKRNFSSDKNKFTQALDEVIEGKVKEFRSEWHKTIDGAFLNKCVEYARENLERKLNIRTR